MKGTVIEHFGMEKCYRHVLDLLLINLAREILAQITNTKNNGWEDVTDSGNDQPKENRIQLVQSLSILDGAPHPRRPCINSNDWNNVYRSWTLD